MVVFPILTRPIYFRTNPSSDKIDLPAIRLEPQRHSLIPPPIQDDSSPQELAEAERCLEKMRSYRELKDLRQQRELRRKASRQLLQISEQPRISSDDAIAYEVSLRVVKEIDIFVPRRDSGSSITNESRRIEFRNITLSDIRLLLPSEYRWNEITLDDFNSINIIVSKLNYIVTDTIYAVANFLFLYMTNEQVMKEWSIESSYRSVIRGIDADFILVRSTDSPFVIIERKYFAICRTAKYIIQYRKDLGPIVAIRIKKID